MEYELSKAHRETITVRKYWGEIMDDLEKEHQAQVRRLLAEIEHLTKCKIELAGQRDEARDKYLECNRQYYDVKEYQVKGTSCTK